MLCLIPMKILIIEDDAKIAEHIRKGLKESGFQVEVCFDGESGLDFALNNVFDLIILDLMLPKIDGLNILKMIRENNTQIPVLILSAKRSIDEKVDGLKHGADDYLIKPFSFVELQARVNALLRRNSKIVNESSHLEAFGIKLDLLKRKVTRDGKEIDLPNKEFLLLEYFLRNPEIVISKTMILEKIYNYNFDTQTNIVDVLVCRLRNNMEYGFDTKLIHTIRGMGYVLKEK